MPRGGKLIIRYNIILQSITMTELTKLSKSTLLEKCAELGITKVKTKKKAELIDLITQKNAATENTHQMDVEDTNTISVGNYYIDDNLTLLRQLSTETVDFIYFDPPYNTGRNFYDFDDKFTSKEYYIQFMTERIRECHRVLKKTGTMVIHIEPRISHYFRFMCDEVFGGDGYFRNEIIWQTGGNAKNKYKLNRFHDTLIVYVKSTTAAIFNPLYFEYDEEYKKKSNVKYCDIHRKEYVTTALYNAQPEVNPRVNLRYNWNGVEKQWYVSKEKMAQLHADNRLEYNKGGIPRIKRFLDEMEGVPLRDIWCDINNIQSGEKMNYATQKPVKLLERIVKLYTNEDGICLDIFAGSGTLGRACINTHRNYLLFDINPKGRELFLESISDAAATELG
jgi:DNA modification methylase